MHSVKHAFKILCVDDNENNLFTLHALLEKLDNIQIFQALSGEKGLGILLHESIDLILLDIQMPNMNGFEFAKLVKSRKKTNHIPVVFLTAVFKSEEFLQEGFAIGAVDYLTKPIDDNQLLNKINFYLQLFEQKRKLQESEKKFYEITQSISEGIYTIDENFVCDFVNDKTFELLGYEKEELLGKNIHNIIHYKTIDSKKVTQSECPICCVFKTQKSYTSKSEYFIKKDNTFLNVSIDANPLFEDGHLKGVLVAFKDNSEQNMLMQLQKEKIQTQEQIIHAMVDMIESRDSYTAGHTKRVALYCEMIAKAMEYSQDDIEKLKKVAWLHDIGKIATPDGVLLKPAKLNNEEYQLIKEHLESGYRLLFQIEDYKEIAEIMREHHERYDGKGYPRGLKGDEISPLGRIMIVADAFDAMTTNRVYKRSKSLQEALKELQEFSKVQFHPEVVAVAVEALKDVSLHEEIMQVPLNALERVRFDYFYKDKLTNLFIKEYLPLVEQEYENNFSIYNIELKNFSQYNERYGWERGNKFLQDFAHFLQTKFPNDYIFRVYGDDFMVATQNNYDNFQEMIAAFEQFKEGTVSVFTSKS